MERARRRATACAPPSGPGGRRAGSWPSSTERRDAAFAEIDGEAERTRSARAGVAGDIPDDLLTLYEKLRAQHGGVGAATALRAAGARAATWSSTPSS